MDFVKSSSHAQVQDHGQQQQSVQKQLLQVQEELEELRQELQQQNQLEQGLPIHQYQLGHQGLQPATDLIAQFFQSTFRAHPQQKRQTLLPRQILQQQPHQQFRQHDIQQQQNGQVVNSSVAQIGLGVFQANTGIGPITKTGIGGNTATMCAAAVRGSKDWRVQRIEVEKLSYITVKGCKARRTNDARKRSLGAVQNQGPEAIAKKAKPDAPATDKMYKK